MQVYKSCCDGLSDCSSVDCLSRVAILAIMYMYTVHSL